MTPLADRAEALLQRSPRLLVPLVALARRLDAAPDALERQLADDERFVLIRPAGFPDLDGLPESRRNAYDTALEAAGLSCHPGVVLARPSCSPDPGVAVQLRESVATLLRTRPDPGLAATGERVMRTLTLALGNRSERGTGPSTTRPPDPLPAAPGRTRRPQPGPRRPPWQGCPPGSPQRPA